MAVCAKCGYEFITLTMGMCLDCCYKLKPCGKPKTITVRIPVYVNHRGNCVIQGQYAMGDERGVIGFTPRDGLPGPLDEIMKNRAVIVTAEIPLPEDPAPKTVEGKVT